MNFTCSECYNYYPIDERRGECLAKYVEAEQVEANQPMCRLYLMSIRGGVSSDCKSPSSRGKLKEP